MKLLSSSEPVKVLFTFFFPWSTSCAGCEKSKTSRVPLIIHLREKGLNYSSLRVIIRVDSLSAEKNGGGYAFVDTLGNTCDSVRRRCDGEAVPEGKILLGIHEKYGVSIDWLLTGNDPAETFMDGLPEDIRALCRGVREILESGDDVIAPALKSDIAAYLTSGRNSRQQSAASVNNRLASLKEAFAEITEALNEDAVQDPERPERRSYNKKIIPIIQKAMKKIACEY
jgi:hypothetical protein